MVLLEGGSKGLLTFITFFSLLGAGAAKRYCESKG